MSDFWCVGLFKLHEHWPSFFCTICFPGSCLFMHLYAMHKKEINEACCCAILFPVIGCAYNRRKFRKRIYQKGDFFADLLAWFYCPPCAAAQEYRKAIKNNDSWFENFFKLNKHWPSCICTICFPGSCLFMHLYAMYNKRIYEACCCAILFPIIGCAYNRGRFRRKIYQDGDFFADLLAWCFCPFCAAAQEYREAIGDKDFWYSDLFKLHEHWPTFFCTICFPGSCLFMHLYAMYKKRIDEACCCAILFPVIGCAYNRGRFREKIFQDGDFFADLLAWFYCPFCAAAQEYRKA